MNPPDANYWLALASQWIQNQAQINFPTNFPQQNPQYTAHTNELNNDATSNDNCIDLDSDMEIEDEEPVNQPVVQKLPSTIYSIAPDSPASKISSTEISYPKFVKIPLAPVISQIPTETSNDAGDMVLDESDEEDSPSSAEAQKRKKLPLWIREGLERMEKTKKQEALRLQKEKEIQKEEENRKRLLQDALMELENEKLSRSKYVSEIDFKFKFILSESLVGLRLWRRVWNWGNEDWFGECNDQWRRGRFRENGKVLKCLISSLQLNLL